MTGGMLSLAELEQMRLIAQFNDRRARSLLGAWVSELEPELHYQGSALVGIGAVGHPPRFRASGAFADVVTDWFDTDWFDEGRA